MTISAPDAHARWSVLMDETVAETFAAMLGLACLPSQMPDSPPPKVSARIEFSGAVQGSCDIAMTSADALRIAEILLSGAADDAMAADTVGELCNLLAGSWKRRLRPPASAAGLSVPVIAHDEISPSSGLGKAYNCDGAQLVVRLTVQQIQEE